MNEKELATLELSEGDHVIVTLKSNTVHSGTFLGRKKDPYSGSDDGVLVAIGKTLNVLEWYNMKYIAEIRKTKKPSKTLS